jgi:hypothetical protein
MVRTTSKCKFLSLYINTFLYNEKVVLQILLVLYFYYDVSHEVGVEYSNVMAVMKTLLMLEHFRWWVF